MTQQRVKIPNGEDWLAGWAVPSAGGQLGFSESVGVADPDTGMAAAVRDGAPAASDPGLVVRPVPVPLSGGDAAATVVEHSVHTTTLLPANPGRRGALIFNESVERLYVKCGGFASASAFTVCLGPFEVWQVPAGYGGRLTGQWSMLSGLADLGRARITEY